MSKHTLILNQFFYKTQSKYLDVNLKEPRTVRKQALQNPNLVKLRIHSQEKMRNTLGMKSGSIFWFIIFETKTKGHTNVVHGWKRKWEATSNIKQLSWYLEEWAGIWREHHTSQEWKLHYYVTFSSVQLFKHLTFKRILNKILNKFLYYAE